MGGSGPKKAKSTTTMEPPKYLQGPLNQFVSAASSQFNNSGGQQLVGQGQDLLSSTLNGDFLSPDSNPYLQGTFDRAADLTRTRLASEFAGNNRDLAATAPARSEELQTLSSNIFGGNYQAERDRQMQGLNQTQQFDPLNMFGNQLAGIIPGAGGTTKMEQPVYKTGLI